MSGLIQQVVFQLGAKQIKSSAYRRELQGALEKLNQEVQYMLDKDIIEPSQSNWASPCVLVPKPDGSIRYYTDYGKVNVLSKTDSFPIPRIRLY